MHMCTFGYFVKNNNQKEMFEMNQENLLMATEALSRYLEQDITTDNVKNIMVNLNNKVRWVCVSMQNENAFYSFTSKWLF